MDDRDLTIDEILNLNKDKEEEKLKQIDEILKTTRKGKKRVCPRCNGQKVIAQYAYHQNGICFMCKGKGYIKGSVF